MREAVHRPLEPRPGPLDEPRGERAAGLDADLLPEHRAHGALERVPGAGHAQAGAPAHEGAEQRIGAQGRPDQGRVRREVEHPAGRAGQLEQRARGRALHAQTERVPARHRAHAHHDGPGRERERAGVALRVHPLDPRDRARGEKREQVGEVVRRAEREAERDLPVGGSGARSPEPPQRARRAVVGLQERVVEAAQAAEARRERDLGHGQVGLVDQPLREVEAAGLRHGERRGADVGDEQAVQVARADAEPGGERVDRSLVERALVDERERPPHDGRGAEPGRGAGRGLGPAAQARPEAGVARRRRGGEVAHVRVAGARRRAHRPAVDAGRGDADEEPPVEAGIARAAGAVERGTGRERGRQGLHDRQLTRRRSRRLAVFGHVSRHRGPGDAASGGLGLSHSLQTLTRRARRSDPIRIVRLIRSWRDGARDAWGAVCRPSVLCPRLAPGSFASTRAPERADTDAPDEVHMGDCLGVARRDQRVSHLHRLRPRPSFRGAAGQEHEGRSDPAGPVLLDLRGRGRQGAQPGRGCPLTCWIVSGLWRTADTWSR